MRIVHIATSDLNGGAARATYRLHTGLVRNNIESILFVRDRQTNDKNVIRYQFPKGFKKAEYKYRQQKIETDFKKYNSTRPKGFEVFSDDRTALKPGFFKQLPEAEIYHLHWTSGFVDLPEFFKMIKKPVVWTLHDMFPFTGGCHYSGDCTKYVSGCRNCSQLGSTEEKDLSYQIWHRKWDAIKSFSNKLIIRADSYWLAKEAGRSRLFQGLDIDVIHYGLDTDVFKPIDKSACRRVLGIPEDRRVIVFGAPGIDNPRKGFALLKEALTRLAENRSDLFLISFGAGKIENEGSLPWLHLGHAANDLFLNIIYNTSI
jgi:glycosyltransferase involved in cell wall biosynthesis